MKPDEITTETSVMMWKHFQRFSANAALHTSLGQRPRIPVPVRSAALKGRSIPPVGPGAGAPRPQTQGEKNCTAAGAGYSPANNTSHASPRCAPREVSSFPGEGPITRSERLHPKKDSSARGSAYTPANNTSPASPRCALGRLLFYKADTKERGRP